jgi:RNA polymerase sigma-70 factor (ECF subfamily)
VRLSPDQLEERLAAARGGSREALGQLLSQCHCYLLQIARRELPRDLQPKGGASDLVQDTYLEAQRFFDRFEGHSAADLRAWLRCLLLHHTAKVGRRFRTTQKRRLAREVSLNSLYRSAATGPREPARTGSGDRSAGGHALTAPVPSPSAHLLAQEQQEILLRALNQLPDDYRTVMLLRYQKGMTFEEIGRDMRRSGDAVRMLWARALERIKYELRPFRETT